MLRADMLTPEVIVISPRFQQYLEGVGASVPAPSDEEMQLFGVPIRVLPGLSTHYFIVSKTVQEVNRDN